MVEPGLVIIAFGVTSVAVCSLAACATFARPKSSSLACPRLVTKMLAGLMSRWTIPSPCAASSASAISIARLRRTSVSTGFPLSTDTILQRYTVQKLHGDKAHAVLLTDFVDRADIGMIQGGSSAGFAAE